MQLPSELIGLLGMLGYEWPESDEESLFKLAGEWTGMADQLAGRIESLQSAARTLLENNQGAHIDAFQREWEAEESSPASLMKAGDPANVLNIGLTVMAGIVLALKIQVIVQLAILAFQIAQAIAFAAVTFGASLVQIPIFKTITGLIIDQMMGMAIDRVLNG
ncbi:WXG100-like domain-containing protein [Glycomyces tarimensis]